VVGNAKADHAAATLIRDAKASRLGSTVLADRGLFSWERFLSGAAIALPESPLDNVLRSLVERRRRREASRLFRQTRTVSIGRKGKMEVSKVSKVPTMPKTPKAPKMSKIPKTLKTAETAETAETAKTAKIAKLPKRLDASSVARSSPTVSGYLASRRAGVQRVKQS
jgi:hypothetical protein